MSLGDQNDGYEGGVGGAGQTRTRLPEGATGDPYGGRRPAGRGSRSLITVVGVVVLLIAAIAFANRGNGEADGAATPNAKNPGAAAPTSATGVSPVGKGWARDEQGAQSAAANYSVALGSADMFDKEKREDILKDVIAPSAIGKFRATLDAAYSEPLYKNVGLNADGTTPPGFTFVSRTVPIGTKTTQSSGNTATVEVWCLGLIGLAGEGSTKPVTNNWFTITMQLEWTEGDWKAVDHTQKEGPAPVGADTRASSAEEIAGAVNGYGGFTYAR